MNAIIRDSRETIDDEVGHRVQELVNKLVREKGSPGGACSLQRLGVEDSALRCHLNLLSSSCSMHQEDNGIDLTPGSVVVVRSYKRT
jgi:hypothetical protein